MAEQSSPDWMALARRGRRHRMIFLGTITVFLTLVSLPVVMPYLWLLTMSVTTLGSAAVMQVFWRAAGLVAVLYLALIVLPPLMPERFRTWVPAMAAAAAVILTTLFILPLTTLNNFRFLWNPDVMAAQQGRSSTIGELPSIWSAMGNSFALAGTQTALILITATPAAYALSRLAFRGRETLSRGILLLHAFPVMALTVAIFIQSYWMGLLNSILGVVLVLTTLELPFAILILKTFFDAVPWDIEMSAVTDGASRWQAFRLVVLPQVSGGLIAVGTFTFLRGWEEYVYVTTLLIDNSHMVMSLYLFWVSQDAMGADPNLIAATGVIYLLPVVALYVFAQKYLTQISFGGIKG
ncbi:carbohydrate ABC transporter permease [Jiella sp. MQZ9-1]|uniref:Maltose/maltodextrin transport system permease protein MalG n=1 Tax=Jiella flava TaxID=2816857 RepID=A0A939FZ82_9HYPH|nr:carbohydrate ABC transporter permease [Jiella flava]MBO0664212.1 carbohydrate ABC transporter permease [Jiella flava]MCD2472858.1 carbohydrate ABC transporter permease [Jiella flava]